MSVIAKLYVSKHVPFGTGSYVELSCIAENDLMAAYATTNEDKLFSKYSPWGEIRLNQRANWAVFALDENHVQPPGPRQAFYAILIPVKDTADTALDKAAAAVKLDCCAKTKFAGDGSRVELRETHTWAKDTATPADFKDRRVVIEKLSWKMQVDNPPAEAQFVPGETYWLLFYSATTFDMAAALALAHGHAPQEVDEDPAAG